MNINIQRSILAAAFLTLWELLSRNMKLEFYVSRPSDIFSRLREWIMDGSLAWHTSVTMIEAISGFMIGSILGVLAGLLLGRAENLARLLDPFVMGFYSLPKIALAPLFILWFGIDMQMKIAFVTVIVFLLVFLNTYTGVRNVSREQISILRLMGANERHLLAKVILPSAIVWVFAGLRLSVPYALIGAVVGEMIATNRGLGYLVAYHSGIFDTAGVLASLTALVIIAMLLNGLVHFAEKRLMPWREDHNRQEVVL
ncbi:MAG: ABC transporter permease [Alphaproteobacteria bacterium]|nr:ABC transporter permease [Alphaproteobacteria bacterium]